MTISTEALDDLRRRFRFRSIGEDGLIFNTESGDIFAANKSAAILFNAFLTESYPQEARAKVSRELALSPSVAEGELALLLQSLAGSLPTHCNSKRRGDFSFEELRDEVLLTLNDRPVLRAFKNDFAVHWLAGPLAQAPCSAYRALLAVAPKLLSLQGHLVLHASAVAVHRQVLVIAGESGAGKTTLAQAFGNAGASVLSEDFCVLESGPSGPSVLGQGERVIREWAMMSAEAIGSGVQVQLNFPSLTARAATKVNELWFIDASRRSPRSDMARHRLNALDTCVQAIPHLFLGTTNVVTLQRTIDEACAFAEGVDGFEIAGPDRLSDLVTAVRRYILTIAS